MGTMKDNFAAAFVLLVLMLSTSQSFPRADENSSKGNSFSNIFSAATTYKCLFVDPLTPTCDKKWMLDSYEDEETPVSNPFDDTLPPPDKVDFSKIRHIVVFTFAGCVPPIPRQGLHSLMPFCKEIPLDKVVSIQRFYPFALKGVKKPPFEFPKASRDQWLRMMTRLRNHIIIDQMRSGGSGSQKGKHKGSAVPKEGSKGRARELVSAAATKEAASNATTTSAANESSSRRVLPSPTKPAESGNEKGARIDCPQSKKENPGVVPAVPAAPTLDKAPDQGPGEKSIIDVPSDELTDDSSGFLGALSNSSDLLTSLDAAARRLSEREIGLSAGASSQAIPDAKGHRFAGKSSSQRLGRLGKL